MDSQEILNILYKRLVGGKLSADESRRLEKWIAENPDKREEMIGSMGDAAGLAEGYRIRNMIDVNRPREEMIERLGLRQQSADMSQRKRNLLKVLRWSVAAVVAAAITTGAILFLRTPRSSGIVADVKVSEPLQIENLSPGGTHAIVTIPSGDTLHISETLPASPRLARAVESGPLQVDVPRGGEFVVTLEDSTKVWLNSESRLVYPAHFSASSRRVELTGEAYFEVTHNPDVPFIVESANQRVRVYGTEFNIRSYPEDEAVYTTLSSGSISLTPASGGGEIFLSPGKQAVFTKETSEAKVRSVDIERVTGWRHGRFVFEEQSLRQIMRDLARWYDFDYEFADDEAAETIFMGSIPRYSNFKTAIAILEKSGGLSFCVKDDVVVISSKQ